VALRPFWGAAMILVVADILKVEVVTVACGEGVKMRRCYDEKYGKPGIYPARVRKRLSQKSLPMPKRAATAGKRSIRSQGRREEIRTKRREESS
jgi:hypothetical protein